MISKVLYPTGEDNEERVALLTGIVQLVSVALERTDACDVEIGNPSFMKSDRGVIGYATSNGSLFICESDDEKEAGEVFKAIQKSLYLGDEEITNQIEKVVNKRGREISGLWG
jgi:hypothetical protein